MDAILCRLQSFIEKVAFVRFRALPMWVGVGRLAGSQFGAVGTRTKLKGRKIMMAKVIEFYVPDTFRTRGVQGPTGDRGKVIEFRPLAVNSFDRIAPKIVQLHTAVPLSGSND